MSELRRFIVDTDTGSVDVWSLKSTESHRLLQICPSKDVIWNYYFFLEGEGNLTAEAEAQMLSKLSEVCTNVRLVGRYPKEQSI